MGIIWKEMPENSVQAPAISPCDIAPQVCVFCSRTVIAYVYIHSIKMYPMRFYVSMIYANNAKRRSWELGVKR